MREHLVWLVPLLLVVGIGLRLLKRRRLMRRSAELLQKAAAETGGTYDGEQSDGGFTWRVARLSLNGVDVELRLADPPLLELLPFASMFLHVVPKLDVQAAARGGPRFEVRPRGTFHQTKGTITLGVNDYLERMFVVTGDDVLGVQAIVSERVLQLLYDAAGGKPFGVLDGALVSDGERVRYRDPAPKRTHEGLRQAAWLVVEVAANAQRQAAQAQAQAGAAV